MNILLMADYRVGLEVAGYLKKKNEKIVGLAVHPSCMENHINLGYTEKIIKLLGLPKERIFNEGELDNGACLRRIKALRPDVILTVFWGFILKPELINVAPKGCINFHCSFLPYNRGKNPNIWPIVEGTPAGVTLHCIDKGIDSGDIIAQRKVDIEPIDTAESLYYKLTEEFTALFKETWPKIKNGSVKSIKQNKHKGTFHYAKDLHKLDLIDLNKKYTARDLINLIRARTFPPFPSAYFLDKGKKVYVRIQLEYGESGT